MSPRHAKIPYRRDLLQKARELRRNSTLGEVLLWCEIKGRRLGCEFHRQVPVGDYILDFFCHEKMLAVEIDGGTHDHEEQFRYDQRREAWLKSRGIHVIRFTEKQVRENMDWVLEALAQRVSDLR